MAQIHVHGQSRICAGAVHRHGEIRGTRLDKPGSLSLTDLALLMTHSQLPFSSRGDTA